MILDVDIDEGVKKVMRPENAKETGIVTALAVCFCVMSSVSWPSCLLAAETGEIPGSRGALSGDDPFEEAPKNEASSALGSGIRGFLQFEAARATASPAHWSKMMTRADFSGNGNLGNGIKWKLGMRVDYDAVFSLRDDYYPRAVERNQRSNVYLRENYLDIGAGGWDFRLGRQHVVWGEMVGLFFADVVSARDMREFILPEFDLMRIPQWAARAEYFGGDFHAELLWIPVASYNLIGKPGAEFYPWQIHPVGTNVIYRNERIPGRTLANSNYGIRLSTLQDGWDVSGFAYSSMDASPTFHRDAVSIPGTYVYRARHDRIHQYGGTVAKDFGNIVLKGEMVYTRGRQFSVLRVLDSNGVTPQNTLDWALGLDFNPSAETRFNVQFYQRRYFSHDPYLIADAREDGYSLLLSRRLTGRLEAQVLWISSLNRGDWLFRPKIAWNFERNWRLIVGADVFNGPPLGLFGGYDGQDRVYSEVRYSF
ncbi:MAG: hypothetical protein LBD06_04805 [Candidatus Accumulibacter sp.]|nr:hypothetical protein [Accumulibacter sp.]